MVDRHSSHVHTGPCITIRIVYGILDISVFQIVHKLSDSHDSTVVLGFLCGCSQMRSYQGIRGTGHKRVGKVCHVFFHFSLFQGLRQSFLIHQKISCEVQDNHALFHLGDLIRADHLSCGFHQRHVNGDIIAFLVDHIQVIDVVNASGKVPRSIHGDEGVISIDFHSQMYRGICHFYTDGAKTDDTQLSAADLTAGKLFFLLFSQLSDILCGFLVLQPLDTAHYIPGCQQHSGNDHLLYTIGICSRCVEDYHAVLCALFQRNIVDAGTCSGNGNHILRKLHLMHVCTSHQHGIRIRHIVRALVFCREMLQSYAGNGI